MYVDDLWLSLAEQTMRQVLTRWSNSPWSVVIQHETVHLFNYDREGGQQRRYLEHLPAKMRTVLERSVQRALRHQQDQLLASQGKRSIGSLVTARVIGRTLYGDLALQIEPSRERRSPLTNGVCPLRYVSPRERSIMVPGMISSYLVIGIIAPLRIGQPVMMRLSRTSRRLPLALLREAGYQGGVRCERRIAGAFSRLTSSDWIPPELLRSVSHELQERIDVRRG